MITWDFSGCMSRESVGVTHYRRHTNRLINITVAHLLTMQIHHAMHQQSKTLRLNIFKVYRMEIGCDRARGNWRCAPARLGRGQTAAACVRLLGVATVIEPDRPLGTLTSLNDQVGLNVRRLLLHLHAASRAPNTAGGQKWVAVDAAPAQEAKNGSSLKAAFWCFSHISRGSKGRRHYFIHISALWDHQGEDLCNRLFFRGAVAKGFQRGLNPPADCSLGYYS